jgi:2-(1,2-epoxy-1,2-dihydrophenyl)acetyl-CoA isomerase
LNRPESGNALNLEVATELQAAAVKVCTNRTVRAVVLTGAGRHFCLGGNIRDMATAGTDVRAYLLELTTRFHASISQFIRTGVPVIAAVNGTAAGAGVGLVAMADLAICAADAKFNLAYTAVGLTPDGGTSFLLPRAIGMKRAMELVLLNRALLATEALSWGIVNRVVEGGQCLEEALAVAERISAGPAQAFAKAKRLIGGSVEAFEAHMRLEGETIATQAVTPEGAEGIKAFLDRKPPNFRSLDADPSP